MAVSLFTLTVLVCSSIGVTTSTSFGHVQVDSTSKFCHHHGVVFSPVTAFCLVHRHWLHTFGITLPDKPSVPQHDTLNCTSRGVNDSLCKHLKPVIMTLNKIQTDMYAV